MQLGELPCRYVRVPKMRSEGTMFEQTFVDGVGKTKRPYTILLSFAIQIVLIGILVIIPLIYYDTLPGRSYRASGSAAAAAASASSAASSGSR